MQTFLAKKPLLSSILINLGLFFLFYSIFYSRFGTTDDIEMQMVLAGKILLQEPSAYLRYSHIFTAQILSTLYSWFPATSWYSYGLVTAHFLGLTALLYSILKLKPSLFRLAFYLLCFVIGETALLQELQFTSAALVLQIGAITLLYLAFSQSENKASKYWYFSSFLMLMLGCMIRWETFVLAVILGSPLLLYALANSSKHRLLKLSFGVFIIISAWGLDQTNYWIHNQDEGWATFHRYKKLGSGQAILDFHNPNYEWTASTADDYFYKVGWEYEDLQLFKHWFFADSSVYGYQQFQALQYAFQDCPLPEEHLSERTWNFFVEYPLDDYIYYSFIILFCSLLFVPYNRWQYLALGSTAIMVFGLLASLFIYRHLPPRVSYAMAFYLISLAALLVGQQQAISTKSKIWTLLLLGFFALSNLKTITKKSSKVAFDKMYWTAALDSLNAQDNQLYIGGGDYYMMPLITPFQSLNDSLFEGFNMLDFGHLANSPSYYQQLHNFDIQNIHIQAIGDSNIYIIHRYESDFLPWYASFIQRHYGKTVKFEVVREDKKLNVAIYKMVADEPKEKTFNF